MTRLARIVWVSLVKSTYHVCLGRIKEVGTPTQSLIGICPSHLRIAIGHSWCAQYRLFDNRPLFMRENVPRGINDRVHRGQVFNSMKDVCIVILASHEKRVQVE